MDRGLNQGKGRGSSAKSTGTDHFVVCLTSALLDLSRRMPIRWFRTRGEGCGGAGSPVCGVRGGAPPDFTERGMGTCFTSAQRAGDVQRGKAAVQRSCGGVAAAPSSVRRRSVGNGRLGVLLVVWCGGGNTRPSCKAVEWVRIAGTA